MGEDTCSSSLGGRESLAATQAAQHLCLAHLGEILSPGLLCEGIPKPQIYEAPIKDVIEYLKVSAAQGGGARLLSHGGSL